MRGKLDLLLSPTDQETEFPVEACWLSQTQEGQTEQIYPQTFDDPFFSQHWHDLHAECSHLKVYKEYFVEVLREFRKRFRQKRTALFKSAQWHFHNTPVHNSILVTDYLTKMGIKTVRHRPSSPDLAPCDFWLFPKLRCYRYETIEERKKAVTMEEAVTCSHKRTSMGPSTSCWNGTTSALQLEEITLKGTRVSCVYYQ